MAVRRWVRLADASGDELMAARLLRGIILSEGSGDGDVHAAVAASKVRVHGWQCGRASPPIIILRGIILSEDSGDGDAHAAVAASNLC